MKELLFQRPSYLSLGDAVSLYTVQTNRFKTARLTLSFVLPADEEGAMLRSLWLGVMRRGSEAYPSLAALNRRLDGLYGTTLTVRNHLHGDTHVLALTAEMLEDRFLLPADRGRMQVLAGVMEVMAEMLLHPLTDESGYLRASAVEAEKMTQCDSIRAEVNDPRTYAAIRFRRLMCPGEPHGISLSGTVEAVEAVTPIDVTGVWRDHISKAFCTLFYVGQASADTVKNAFTTAFRGWAPTCMEKPVTQPHVPPSSPRREEEERPIGQGRLCMGWTLSALDVDPAVATVFNELIGPMQGSLLFSYVRETLGLCYECTSSVDITKGIFSASCGIRSDRASETEAAVCRMLDKVKNGDISRDIVTAATTSLLNGYRQLPDSPAGMENFWLHGMMDGRMQTPAERMARLSAVTVEDVVEVAEILVPDTVYFLKGTLPPRHEEDSDI